MDTNKQTTTLDNLQELFEKDSSFMELLNLYILSYKNKNKFFINVTNDEGEYVLLSNKIELFISIIDNPEYKEFIQNKILGISFQQITYNDKISAEETKIYLDEIFSYYGTLVKATPGLDLKVVYDKFQEIIDNILISWIEAVTLILLNLEKFKLFSKEKNFELYTYALNKISSLANELILVDNQEELLAIITSSFSFYEPELYKDEIKNKERNIIEYFANLNDLDELSTIAWRTLLNKHRIKFKEEPEKFARNGWKEMLQSFKEIDPKSLNKKFIDVIGLESVKKEFQDVIDYFKNTEEFIKYKVKIPKGIILHWNPWTWKTFLAKAFAKEVNIPFFYISASELIELYVWMGAKKVRDLFDAARKKGKAIIYIDEIDSIGSREKGESSENRQTVNQLLTEMDGFDIKDSIFVIASTNNIHDLDKALLRSWRFDKKIYVPLPTEDDRKKIFSYYLNQYSPELKLWEYDKNGLFKTLNESDLNEMIDYLSKETAWMSPADIESVINEAVLLSFRDYKHTCFNLKYAEEAIKKNKKGFMFDDKTNIKEIYWKDIPYRFDDVIWLTAVKQEFKDIVYYLENRKSFSKYNIKIPKGVLLYGPPGTWKTSIAKALAKEAGVPFFYISASEFQSDSFVATWTQNIKKLFAKAKEKAPSIIFIDEIDAIGSRNSGVSSESSSKLINQLLTEIDWFADNDDVFVMAATNFKEKLDPALLREGRFDKKIMVSLPDKGVREKLFNYFIKKYTDKWVVFGENSSKSYTKIQKEKIIANLVKKTTYFAPSKIEALVKDASLNWKKLSEIPFISEKLLDDSWRKIVIWVKNDMKVTVEELKDTAYHEAGHAIMSMHYWRPVNEISIISTWWALGYMLKLESDDKAEFSSTKEDLQHSIDISMGWRVAENVYLNKITTWISGDMENVTHIIQSMTDTYKFFGPFLLEKDKLKIQQKEFLDSEKRVKNLLVKNKTLADKIVEELLEKEILNHKEFETLWKKYYVK